MVNEWITVTLSTEDRHIAMAFVVVNRMFVMPVQQDRQTILGVFGGLIIDLSFVSEEKVESGPGDGPFSVPWFEFIAVSLATVILYGFFKISEVKIWRVSSKTIASGFAGEQMM